jgi:hypothetical protein
MKAQESRISDEIAGQRLEDGVVWIQVRVNGHLYEVGALEVDQWSLRMPVGVLREPMGPADGRDGKTARELAIAWASQNRDQLALLFREAEKQRRAKIPSI